LRSSARWAGRRFGICSGEFEDQLCTGPEGIGGSYLETLRPGAAICSRLESDTPTRRSPQRREHVRPLCDTYDGRRLLHGLDDKGRWIRWRLPSTWPAWSTDPWIRSHCDPLHGIVLAVERRPRCRQVRQSHTEGSSFRVGDDANPGGPVHLQLDESGAIADP
jgi:hypothetical protein